MCDFDEQNPDLNPIQRTDNPFKTSLNVIKVTTTVKLKEMKWAKNPAVALQDLNIILFHTITMSITVVFTDLPAALYCYLQVRYWERETHIKHVMFSKVPYSAIQENNRRIVLVGQSAVPIWELDEMYISLLSLDSINYTTKRSPYHLFRSLSGKTFN